MIIYYYYYYFCLLPFKIIVAKGSSKHHGVEQIYVILV